MPLADQTFLVGCWNLLHMSRQVYSQKLRVLRKGFDWDTYLTANFDVKSGVGPERRVCCPFCAENKYKMYVNIDKRYFNCFKCETSNRKADVFDFIAETEGLKRGQAIKQCLVNFSEVCPSAEEIEEALHADQYEEEEIIDTGIKAIDKLPHYARILDQTDGSPGIDAERCFAYLDARGVTGGEIEDMQVHYIPEGNYPLKVDGKFYGNMQNRILWPIYGGNQQLVSWIARTIDPKVKDRKYINCPKSELAKTLWPYVPPRTKEVVLVEGILDCLAVRRLGFDAYATFGKHTSLQQRELLEDWGVEEITLCYDNDAKSSVLILLDDLRLHFKLFVPEAYLPNNQDAGDTLRSEGDTLRGLLNKSLENAISVDSNAFIKWRMFT